MSSLPNPSAARPAVSLSNDGSGPLKVPGFGSIAYDLDLKEQPGGRFAHGANDFHAERMTVKELAMLRLMDAITDKPEWTRKIFDEAIVAKWHDESVTMPEITEAAWQWCLTELRDRAPDAEEKRRTLTFDSASPIAKADRLVPEELRDALRALTEPLRNIPDAMRDWHPGSDDKVLNLVHPSLFPLVYGRTAVLQDGGVVDLDNITDSCGQGTPAPVPKPAEEDAAAQQSNRRPSAYRWTPGGKSNIHYSKKFQWLPCDVDFVGDTGTNVHIASYINNLHPAEHKALYGTVEKLISLAIPVWDEIVVEGAPHFWGRTPLRIKTFGPSWQNHLPKFEYTFDDVPGSRAAANFQEMVVKVKDYLALPDRERSEDDEESDWDEEEDEDMEFAQLMSVRELTAEQAFDRRLQLADEYASEGRGNHENAKSYTYKSAFIDAVEWKYKRSAQVLCPDPGKSFSYEEWKQGVQRAAEARPRGSRITNADSRRRESYTVNLEKDFRDKGLQVIVKLASIELTPEKPGYEGGSWHIEGMLNEHIVATAIYYYDVENVTKARLAFRQEAMLNDMELIYEQDEHKPLCKIFGTDHMRDEPAVQELGSIATPGGRMLCFPNTLQHRVGSFGLADPTKPGHRRFVVLWLVDPHYRVCSTRNVPPQRNDWWARDVDLGRQWEKLPPEVAGLVKDYTDDWPMSMDEAKKLRLELMAERTLSSEVIEQNFEQYNLCEH